MLPFVGLGVLGRHFAVGCSLVVVVITFDLFDFGGGARHIETTMEKFRLLLRSARSLSSWAAPNAAAAGRRWSSLGSAQPLEESASADNTDSVVDKIKGAAEAEGDEVNASQTKGQATEEPKDNADELFHPFEAHKDPSPGTFQYLFEKSHFVQAMDPVGKEVEADVIAVVGDKLYVDFGCKFHAVVTCPTTLQQNISRGAKVVVLLEDLEVTRAFIGKPKHDSLLEAKAKFIRLKI